MSTLVWTSVIEILSFRYLKCESKSNLFSPSRCFRDNSQNIPNSLFSNLFCTYFWARWFAGTLFCMQVLIRGVTWLLQQFPQLADRLWCNLHITTSWQSFQNTYLAKHFINVYVHLLLETTHMGHFISIFILLSAILL